MNTFLSFFLFLLFALKAHTRIVCCALALRLVHDLKCHWGWDWELIGSAGEAERGSHKAYRTKAYRPIILDFRFSMRKCKNKIIYV